MPPRRRRKRKGVKPVRMKHIVNCLFQIEIWCKAIRHALATLDQDALVTLQTKEAIDDWANGIPPRRISPCPPND